MDDHKLTDMQAVRDKIAETISAIASSAITAEQGHVIYGLLDIAERSLRDER